MAGPDMHACYGGKSRGTTRAPAVRAREYTNACKAARQNGVATFSLAQRNGTKHVALTRRQYYKTFYGRKLRLFIISETVCSWECQVQAPALPTNIKRGWKGLPGTNALASNEKT